GLNRDGGIFLDTSWYDAHLWCETSMDDSGADGTLEHWRSLGIEVPAKGEPASADVCVAASLKGPLGPCPWLRYDAEEDCAWLAGTEQGLVIGGQEHVASQERLLEEWSAKGEQKYAAMYDSKSIRDDYEDAGYAFARAVEIAKFLHKTNRARELEARTAH